MPSPFPGMNPYLEHPDLWTEVHHLMIGILAETLNPQLLPNYRAAIEKRVYQSDGQELFLVGIPDVTVEQRAAVRATQNLSVATTGARPMTVTLPMSQEVREAYLEIRELVTKQVVTVIEILSPANKRAGRGRDTYLTKRQEILASATHLIEIDLLRAGEAMPVLGDGSQNDYRILVSRSDRRPRADLYPFDLTDSIPTVLLPLKANDREPVIDLDAILEQVYERAGFAVVIDYHQNPIPALPEPKLKWLDEQLQRQQLRP